VDVECGSVPRPTKTPQPGKPFHLHIVLQGDLVLLVDEFAAQGAGERFATKKARTDAVRVLLTDGLRKRGLLK
jgi:hypothetical protein